VSSAPVSRAKRPARRKARWDRVEKSVAAKIRMTYLQIRKPPQTRMRCNGRPQLSLALRQIGQYRRIVQSASQRIHLAPECHRYPKSMNNARNSEKRSDRTISTLKKANAVGVLHM
jgi:hypothetical protein